MIIQWLVTCVLLIDWIQGDVYFHNPRGSNNRLNEKTANRKTNNRMFDSQNNNRGGYNVGDLGAEPSKSQEEQYMMKYFQSSADAAGKTVLEIEWTNQHGCGGNDRTNPQKQNCDLILQYMCQDDVDAGSVTDDTIRNGQSTSRQQYTEPGSEDETETERQARKDADVDGTEGLHETWDNYNKCYFRERNNGLFTADQNLNNNKLKYSSAIYTRQNSNGNRNGYECPEERDYYPYWHPTQWKDIVIMTDDTSRCSFYRTRSFNTRNYHECVGKFEDGTTKGYSRWNNKVECESDGGIWTEFSNFLEKDAANSKDDCEAKSYKWAVPSGSDQEECLVPLDKPECKQAPWSRTNHQGNGVDGEMNRYSWIIPHFPSGNAKRCVLRMRYNISTDDYDPTTDSTSNQQDSTIMTDPVVDIGVEEGLRLNINTAQFSRTFQDRTHAFIIRDRLDDISNDTKIYNLNVRGKRGNIVQTFPALEYDFVPNNLKIKENDLVHIQWTGSNTHDNNSPGGDGATGDDGQGKGGTDRHNFVQIKDSSKNFPWPFEESNMWSNANVKWPINEAMTAENLALYMASGGHFKKGDEVVEEFDGTFNDVSASFGGVVIQFQKGTFNYMCTRNNAFTNRSQKGKITVR